MKKTVIIVLVLIFCHFENYGQKNKKNSVQFDIGTSITIPYKQMVEFRTLLPINGNGSSKTNYKTNFGYFAEILSDYNINENISITAGFNYNYTSYKIKDGEDIMISEGNLNNSYLNIPLLFNYRLSEKNPISISAGAYLGLLLFAQEKGTSYLDTSKIIVVETNDPLLQPEQKYDNNIKEDYYSIDYGVLFQLKYEYKWNEKMSGVFFSRFNYGLKNVLSSSLGKLKAKHNAATEWKNYNILIGIGIKI